MFVRRGILIIGLTLTFMPIGTVFSSENENWGISHENTANGKANKRRIPFEQDRGMIGRKRRDRSGANDKEPVENDIYIAENYEEPVDSDTDVAENEEYVRTFPDVIDGTPGVSSQVRVAPSYIECLLPNGGQNTPIVENASCYIFIKYKKPDGSYVSSPFQIY